MPVSHASSPSARGKPRLQSTRTLILRIRSGDDSARQELFTRFVPALRQWAHGRLPSRARSILDTDDLIQDTFLKAVSRVDHFDPRHEGAFLAYLHQILLNCLREELRRLSNRSSREELADDMPEERSDLLERALGPDVLEAYDEALASLSEDHQHAVILRIEFGFSHGEIAAALGRRTPDAARMLVARGLTRLAKEMASRCPASVRNGQRVS